MTSPLPPFTTTVLAIVGATVELGAPFDSFARVAQSSGGLVQILPRGEHHPLRGAVYFGARACHVAANDQDLIAWESVRSSN